MVAREVVLAGPRHRTGFRELLGDTWGGGGMRILLSLKAGAATTELHTHVRDREAAQGRDQDSDLLALVGERES